MRSFTDASRSIVTAVITMAKELGIKTLAEGVETKEHADFLASIGCGRQQGYFYGKPQPIGGTLAHIESEGRGIEPRKWCHYYDVASMFIRQTDRACALFDRYGDGHVHCLYANKTYGEQIHELGYQLQDIEEDLGARKQRRSCVPFGRMSTVRARAVRWRRTFTSMAATMSIRRCR